MNGSSSAGNPATVQPESPAPTSSSRELAVRFPAANARFWLFALGGLALDLWSKHWAFTSLGQGGHVKIIPYVLEFQTLMNSGALFGFGRGWTTLFLAASVFALVLVMWMFVTSDRRRWLLHIALGAIFAGALGNMYDRMFVRLVRFGHQGVERYYVHHPQADGSAHLYLYPPTPDTSPLKLPPALAERLRETGYVRDFLKIPTTFFGRELWPWVFNVADALLVGGVAVLAVYLWRDRPGGE